MNDDPLAVLLAIERLEVGPVTVEADRLTCPYTVQTDETEDRFDLTYRWEEPVFDPTSTGDHNLATMIGAQVALNYGLFCREIAFQGPLDSADRGFLERMTENTSREIYALKILGENRFLREPAVGLPAVQRPTFTQAKLTFPDPEPAPSPAWPVDRQRYAVLSSGGKDSLLSYGLLSEIGVETHPIFVNESGRHWFTALNAYRHFAAVVPHTARVWSNCDRLFAWMLRHLPFIRPDFQQVRADYYPIRLWTVAVFLFGALPLLAKRGIGRLVIGDEHDTTVRGRRDGIPHYAGLYDQSRWFDDALSRYFRRKRWGITQLSVLRPCSELLIQRVLAERYPQLLAQQVSCHATHTEGDRVVPCGRCEKCRRVVGMLTAVGADPRSCGYSDEAIAACLTAFVASGVHQETEGAEHLAHLLSTAGHIDEPRAGAIKAAPRDSVEQLRFHPERSPIEGVPRELRRPLYDLFLAHSRGAVHREGRRWVEIDLRTAPGMEVPYPFDRPLKGEPGKGDERFLWGELSWPEAEERLRRVDVALLPVGAIEQHGLHLPLDTDSFDADYLARRVAAACSEPKPLVLPLIPYGVSYHHDDFKGTLSLSNETLARLVWEIGLSAAKNGITKLIIINGHGGNDATLHFAAQMINRDAHIFTTVDSGETSDTDIEAIADTPNDVHAGEIETSTTLAVRPHLVKMDLARRFVPSFSSGYLDFTSQRSVTWYARTAKISKTGVLGDATKATREKGEKIWEVMVKNLVELVEHLKDLSLSEIYERRY